MSITFKTIVGSLRVLRRRVNQIGRPGLAIWADAGEQAATAVSERVGRGAHADEIADLEAKKEIEASIEDLRAGRPVATAIKHLKRADRLVAQSAELAHDISEDVRL